MEVGRVTLTSGGAMFESDVVAMGICDIVMVAN